MLEEIDHYDGRTAVKSRTYELQAGGVYKASKIRRTRASADQSPRRGVELGVIMRCPVLNELLMQRRQ